ncbi:MipA/OmpV family protein [Paracoccus sp. (in: a-proteobacteria)]|uniref:MipA/OmpV family protein n=1 Tax=Paracoccus sp. TaxID=267 RepID=UPI003A853213
MKYLLPLLLLAAPVQAQDLDLGYSDRQFSFDVGIGASYQPKYPGADDSEARPWPIFRNVVVSHGPASMDTVEDGFSIAPSFRVLSSRDRDDADNGELDGLNEVDASFEGGVKLRYRVGPASAYGTLRYGFLGHHGFTGEIGADYSFAPAPRVVLTLGAEAGYGDSDVNDTYFGISQAESVRSGYRAYDPGSGFNSAAAYLAVRYALTDRTALVGEVKYVKLISDVADSPIVRDDSQPVVQIGIVRRFSLGL